MEIMPEKNKGIIMRIIKGKKIMKKISIKRKKEKKDNLLIIMIFEKYFIRI